MLEAKWNINNKQLLAIVGNNKRTVNKHILPLQGR